MLSEQGYTHTQNEQLNHKDKRAVFELLVWISPSVFRINHKCATQPRYTPTAGLNNQDENAPIRAEYIKE